MYDILSSHVCSPNHTIHTHYTIFDYFINFNAQSFIIFHKNPCGSRLGKVFRGPCSSYNAPCMLKGHKHGAFDGNGDVSIWLSVIYSIGTTRVLATCTLGSTRLVPKMCLSWFNPPPHIKFCPEPARYSSPSLCLVYTSIWSQPRPWQSNNWHLVAETQGLSPFWVRTVWYIYIWYHTVRTQNELTPVSRDLGLCLCVSIAKNLVVSSHRINPGNFH